MDFRAAVRRQMDHLAKPLNRLSGGKLTADRITLIGLAMHLPIAWLITQDRLLLAASGLVIFGLFDALDGAMARVQHTVGNRGMLLDASTDRFKEVLLYIGIASYLVNQDLARFTPWVVAACGASLLVSYVKAKGETAVAGGNVSANEVNRLFQEGLFRFEIRMAILVLGLLSGRLVWATVFIAISSGLTAIGRLARIYGKLDA